jgi:O-methyltransferase domain
VRNGYGAAIRRILRDYSEAGSRLFDDAMTAKAHGQVAGVIASYDFRDFKVIGDIGGGRGHLLRAVLRSAPHATGVLFDRPHVIEQASAAAFDRLTLQAGDFFTDDLPVCDGYLLMEVIHDWDDERAAKILERVRSAARPQSKVLLIEAIIPNGTAPSWPKTLDILMLLIGGQQRTLQEYATLLEETGFTLTREIDTHTGVSIIEAVCA